MRKPAVLTVVVVAPLLVAGSPFLRAEFGQIDASVLPSDNPVRVATEQLGDELPALSGEGVQLVLVGGTTAQIVDLVDAIGERLPLMFTVLAGAVLVLLFLAFGSLLVPVKAVVLSALSLTASFGVVVWIFQYGHLVDVLGTQAGPLDPIIPVLMLAVLFGLSTD